MWLTHGSGYANRLRITGLIKWDGSNLGAFLLAEWPYFIIETLNADLSLTCPHAAEQKGQRIERIGGQTTVQTGMQIALGFLHIYLQRD